MHRCLQDVHTALQTALRDRPEVASALLSECLPLVLDTLAAVHCLLAVLPALGPELRSSFCRKIVTLLEGPGVQLRPQGVGCACGCMAQVPA